jgi:hypothetical protein
MFHAEHCGADAAVPFLRAPKPLLFAAPNPTQPHKRLILE